MDVYVDAKPIEPLTMPIYPTAALKARTGEIQIRVVITVSNEGQVARVDPSLCTLSGVTPYYKEFYSAVEAAISTWRFEPAQIARLKPGPTGKPVVVGIEETERVFDVLISFSGSGKVSSSALKKRS